MTDTWKYPNTCTIHKRTAVTVATVAQVDALGQPLYEYLSANYVSAVPCHFDDTGTVERYRGGFAVQLESPKIIVPYGTNLAAGDRIADIKEGSTVLLAGPFEVTGRPRDPGLEHDHLEADLERAA